ncbi:MAG: Acyl-CoA:1-acyl-sn-glycerol-3-phosphate acyltransferase, partial [uncultured Ramlibacter sp.]
EGRARGLAAVAGRGPCAVGPGDHPVRFPPPDHRAAQCPGAGVGAAHAAGAGDRAATARRRAGARTGAAGGQPHLLARHPGHACGPALPLRVEVRGEALAADRRAGHRRGHALHRAGVAPRCAAGRPPHGRAAAGGRHPGDLPGRHDQRRCRPAALPWQPDPGCHLREGAGAARRAAIRRVRHGAHQPLALLHRRRHAAAIDLEDAHRSRHHRRGVVRRAAAGGGARPSRLGGGPARGGPRLANRTGV